MNQKQKSDSLIGSQKETKRTKESQHPSVSVVAFCSKSFCLFLCAFVIPAVAATNDLTTLLQRGLFEEEANRNLDAAITSYESLAKQFDKDRQIAATAVFRLGECYRKLGKTNEAVVQYERILRDFSDQPTLATLSRQNISAIAPTAVSSQDAVRPASTYEYVIQTGDTVSSIVGAIRKSGVECSVDSLLRMNPALNPTRLRVGQKILMPTGALNQVTRGTADGDVAAEAKALAAKLNGLERFKDDPEKHARAVLSLFPDVGLRNLLDALESTKASVITNKSSEMEKLLGSISSMASRIISDQKFRLEVLKATAESSDAVTETPLLDDEEKEIRRIQAMIQNSPDLINAPNGNNGTVLFRAARDGQLRVAAFLLDHGADINGRSGIPIGQDGGNWTPLMVATDHGHKAIVELLLDRRADVNAKSGGTGTALHIACKRGFRAIVDVLLRHKADPNVTDWEKTPLHEAASAGNSEIVKALIVSGADVNAKAPTGSPIWMAVWLGHVDIVKALLAAKADPDIPGEKGLTPLCIAAQDRPEMVDLLLTAKADPNVAAHSNEEKDNTPLHYAVQKDSVPIVEALLKAGANPNAKSRVVISPVAPGSLAPPSPQRSGGQSPLFYATRKEIKPEISKLLLNFKADPNLADANSSYPLDWAVAYGNVAVAELLLKHGATVSRPQRHSVLWSTTDHGDKAIVELLLGFHPDVNARNPNGETALDACKRGAAAAKEDATKTTFNEIASLLRAHGALDEVPDFSVIKVKWLGQERGVPACWAHTNGWNRFTLMEALARVSGSDYPDFSRVLIHRPAGNGRPHATDIKANLLNATNGIDCTKDIWLEFGDVVEVPDRDHALSEEPRILRDQQRREIEFCLRRQVQLVVRGEIRELTLFSFATLSSALSQPSAKSLLLSSSDLTHIKVTRKIPGQQQPVQMAVNVAPNPPWSQDLWLRDGDVIEVPEK